MVLLCMLAPVWRRSMMIFVKQLKKYKNEIYLSCYKEVTITHKLRYQPFSSLSSSCMCWMGSIFFSFLQENTWKLIFNANFFFFYLMIEKFNDYILHLKHVIVEMAPPAMQFFPFLWTSPCTPFWTFLLAYFWYELIHILRFS